MIFDPRHTLAKVPEGAKAGDKLNVALYDGLKTAYVLPPGFKPGDEINLRHSKEHEEVVVNLKKTEETSSLGLAIKSQKTRPYPFVIDVDPVGPSKGVLAGADEIMRIKGVTAKASFDIDCMNGTQRALCRAPAPVRGRRIVTRDDRVGAPPPPPPPPPNPSARS